MELKKKYYFIKQAKLIDGELYVKGFFGYYKINDKKKLQKVKRINMK